MDENIQKLWGTKDLQLNFGLNNPTDVKGYTNFDYASNPENWKSMSGYVFTYGGGAISWRSKLQDYTTLSTSEPEYIVGSKVAKEAIWLH